MNIQELENYEELQNAFQMRCEMICDILKPLDNSFEYVYDFRINNDLIICKGTEYWSCGDKIEHYAEFPKDYICLDDKEIQKIVTYELKKRADEEARIKSILERQKTEKEKAEYERLKKIYG